MSKLVYSALALTLVSTPSIASENEWSSLDQEIANLSASLSAQNAPGPKLGGYLKIGYFNSSDEDALFGGPPNDEKESGFKLLKVRVEVSGDAGADYHYKISFELSSGSAALRDAYVTWKVADNVNGEFGNFKQPFLRSGLISDTATLFLNRSTLGEIFSGRQEGLMFFGSFDTVSWWISGQNGVDGKNDDWLFTGRITANLMGGGVGKLEGAYGANDETNLTLGAAFSDEQNLDKGQAWALEAYFTHGPFAASGEVVGFDSGDPGTTSLGLWDYHYGSDNSDVSWDAADNTPWAITISYMFTEMYEAMVRYEDADDTNNGEAWQFGVNRYIQGHDIKWTAQYLTTSSDVATQEIDEWAIGLTLAF